MNINEAITDDADDFIFALMQDLDIDHIDPGILDLPCNVLFKDLAFLCQDFAGFRIDDVLSGNLPGNTGSQR